MNIELESNDEHEDEPKESLNSEQSLNRSTGGHSILFSTETSFLYSSQRPEARYIYDYEVNNVKSNIDLESDYILIKSGNNIDSDNYIKINPSEELHDSLDIPYFGDSKILNPNNSNKRAKANIFKRLVSKKKRRLQTEFYDLDMCYITKRVIGMGFPSTGCETFYRNSLIDTIGFLQRYHQDYKIYNLCIEKKRIYPKDFFPGKKVALFPFNDHAPCPIKLILDFCIDLCLYLTVSPKGVAGIHCKAGKGRTGVMIVCYLIFSGLCKNAEEALIHYASQRTLNNKGVTIASQKRYIYYFESFLSANFEKPYLKCIPKIIKYEISRDFKNMIINFNIDSSYFSSINFFRLKSCLIGPFENQMYLNFNFSALTKQKLKFNDSYIHKSLREDGWYYEIKLNSEEDINCDLKLSVKGKNITFYSWFNLWYTTFEIINNFIISNNYFENNDNRRTIGISSSGKNLLNEEDNKVINTINQEGEKPRRSGTLKMALNTIEARHGKVPNKNNAKETMKNNKDLNVIIDNINQLAQENGVEKFDRKNLTFTIDRKDLDKMKTKCKDNFKVVYNYQLIN